MDPTTRIHPMLDITSPIITTPFNSISPPPQSKTHHRHPFYNFNSASICEQNFGCVSIIFLRPALFPSNTPLLYCTDLLEDVANGNQVVATEASHIMEDSTKPRRFSSTCAWVNVIYGCNERCTYCIVPTTRGVEQSVSAHILSENQRMLCQN